MIKKILIVKYVIFVFVGYLRKTLIRGLQFNLEQLQPNRYLPHGILMFVGNFLMLPSQKYTSIE